MNTDHAALRCWFFMLCWVYVVLRCVEGDTHQPIRSNAPKCCTDTPQVCSQFFKKKRVKFDSIASPVPALPPQLAHAGLATQAVRARSNARILCTLIGSDGTPMIQVSPISFSTTGRAAIAAGDASAAVVNASRSDAMTSASGNQPVM
jgi:hypothetical protein